MSWRKMTFIIVAASVLLLCTVMAINYIVNPFGKYASDNFPSLVWTGRADKVSLIERYESKDPEVLIIGSSRSMKIDPGFIEQKTGLKAFNAGVNSARVEDYFVMLNYALNELKMDPEYIFLGIDLEAFHNNTEPDSRLVYNRKLAKYLNEEDQATKLAMMKSLISYDQTIASAKSLAYSAASYPGRNISYEPDGFLHYEKKEAKIAAGTFEPDIQTYVKKYKNRFNNFTAISEKRKDYFTDFLALADQNDIQVVGFITTLHDDVIEALQETRDYEKRKTELKSFLAKMHQQYPNFTFEDYDSVKAYDGSITAFYDGAHIHEKNANKITLSLLKKSDMTLTAKINSGNSR